MKQLRITSAVLLAVAVLLTLGVVTVSAQGPVAYLDNQTHTIAANGSTMYRFDYALNSDGTRPDVTITMVNGTNSGLGFQVWAPEIVNDMADNKPTGIGSPLTIDCNTGEITAAGGCQSPDLIWTGAFGSGGAYYVLVTNSTANQMSYALKISGSGFSLGQQVASAASAPAQGPAAAPAISTNTDDPAKAVAIDGQSHTVAANSATWYSFNYGLNDDGTHPTKTIILVNGAQSGLTLQVWSAEAFNGGWWNNLPVGQGTSAALDCSTMEVAGQGGCQSSDLTWLGAFGAPGTYYVRVVNNTGAPVNYTLTIQ
jgi:hypothetical protein